jgi:hypothetical protein
MAALLRMSLLSGFMPARPYHASAPEIVLPVAARQIRQASMYD